MGRGRRTGLKQRSNQHVRKKIMDSEDSDEDYVAEVDDQSEELDPWVADASQEESCFEAEEEELDEEEELEEEEDRRENGWRTIVKPKPKTTPKLKSKPSIRKRFAGSYKNRIRRPMKRRKVPYNVDDSNDEDNDDDDDDDDDDDEEFTPDEIEHLEEEEDDKEEDEDDEEEEEEKFPPVKSKSKKRGRASLKGKKAMRRQRRERRTKIVKKPPEKKGKGTGSSRWTTEPAEDEYFSEEGWNLRGRTNRNSVRRKKRVKDVSDSYFCSNSSDCDFTISEEEREQVREANELCRTLPTNLRSSRRIQEDDDFCEPKRPPARKGKEKAEEKKNDTGKPVCGICLTEEGKNTIRGMLNCCSHYFCFACIMEWSKVETRCPLCKQRFVTISKPARCSKGFDLRDAVISVPERDQVYQPSEEVLGDFLNPYENVICTECHHGGDDALMLLCDLCDSPAHTYCVGLGHEVPEGNWYCDGCTLAALASLHTQTEDLSLDQRPGAEALDGQSTFENMAEIDLNVTIPETPVSQGNEFLSSPRFLGGNFQAPSPSSGIGVSTVSVRRRIHHQIQNIFSNRRSQNGGDISSLDNLISLGFNSQQGNRTTEVGTSHHAQRVDILLQSFPNNEQSCDFFPGRQGHMMGQVDQQSTAADSSARGHLRCGVSATRP